MMTPRQMADLDRWLLRSPPDDDSDDVTYCDICAELKRREDLDRFGICEDCMEDMTIRSAEDRK